VAALECHRNLSHNWTRGGGSPPLPSAFSRQVKMATGSGRHCCMSWLLLSQLLVLSIATALHVNYRILNCERAYAKCVPSVPNVLNALIVATALEGLSARPSQSAGGLEFLPFLLFIFFADSLKRAEFVAHEFNLWDSQLFWLPKRKCCCQ